MADWYRTHSLSPEAYPESEYLSWAQDNGLYVDAAGNVDYGPPSSGGPCPNYPPCPHPASAHDPAAGSPGEPPWCLDCDCGDSGEASQ